MAGVDDLSCPPDNTGYNTTPIGCNAEPQRFADSVYVWSPSTNEGLNSELSTTQKQQAAILNPVLQNMSHPTSAMYPGAANGSGVCIDRQQVDTVPSPMVAAVRSATLFPPASSQQQDLAQRTTSKTKPVPITYKYTPLVKETYNRVDYQSIINATFSILAFADQCWY